MAMTPKPPAALALRVNDSHDLCWWKNRASLLLRSALWEQGQRPASPFVFTVRPGFVTVTCYSMPRAEGYRG